MFVLKSNVTCVKLCIVLTKEPVRVVLNSYRKIQTLLVLFLYAIKSAGGDYSILAKLPDATLCMCVSVYVCVCVCVCVCVACVCSVYVCVVCMYVCVVCDAYVCMVCVHVDFI